MEKQLRDAIACITVRQGGQVVNRGTGFLVAPGVVLTALHVTAPEGDVELAFPGHTTAATRGRLDADLDWAELKCAEPPFARPLPLGEASSKAAWEAYGWPDAQSLDGMVVHGTVTNPRGELKGHPALQLFCEEAAAGRGMKLSGLSGGPVLVDGRVVGLARFALMAEGRAEAGTFYATPIQPAARALGLAVAAPRTRDADLDVLLDRVHHFWIEGVLERSLHGVAVDIGMEPQPDAVEHPWEAVVEQPDEPSRVMAPGTTVAAVFDEVQGSLLILGEPGSGKTTALLTLARDLATRGGRVPVVLHLSTWTGGALRDWALAELRSKYQIPESVGRPWLDDHRLVLLLDGLDEVAAERRAACVEAINGYESLAGVAVTCRATDYEALPGKLKTNGAICLQPLTEHQIEDYVAAAGPALAGLAEALRRDAALRDLAKSPLMLGVMAQAYRDTPAETLAREHSVAHLFDTFIERMFKRPEQAYPRRRTERALRRIARDLQRRRRSVFLIEDLQPDAVSRWVYRIAFVGVFGLVVGALTLVAPLQPNLNLPPRAWPWLGATEAVPWLLAGPLWVLGVVLTERRRPVLAQFAVFLALFAPIAVAMSFLIDRKRNLFVLLLVSLVAAARSQSHALAGEIRPTESLGFDWARARRWALWGIVAGAAHTLLALFVIERSTIAPYGFMVAGALVGAILGGPQPRVVKGKTRPNEGMRLTRRTAGRMALLAIPPVAVAPVFLGLAGFTGHITQYTVASLLGAMGALVVWFGGLDLIKHYLVRLLVDLPLNLPRFLEHARRLNFVQRVGSGYIFTHRLLRDHFAEREVDNGT